MTKKLVFIIVAMLALSCIKKECCVVPGIELSGKFVHQIPDCANNDNVDRLCEEWFEIINGSEVDLVYGGLTMVHRFKYSKGVDVLYLEGPPTSSFKPIFSIVDEATLKRIDTGDIWKKQ